MIICNMNKKFTCYDGIQYTAKEKLYQKICFFIYLCKSENGEAIVFRIMNNLRGRILSQERIN